MDLATPRKGSTLNDHKAQVGRALKGSEVIGIYHDKREILILAPGERVIRYLPLEDFKLIYQNKTYCNVTLHQLKNLVQTGTLNG